MGDLAAGWLAGLATFTASGTAEFATGYALTGPASGAPGAAAALTLAYEPTGAVPPASLDGTGGVCRILVSDGDATRSRFRLPSLVGFPEAQAAAGGDVTYPAGYLLAGPAGIGGLSYQPASLGSYTITSTNAGSLTDPAAFAFAATTGTRARLRIRRHA